MMAGTKHLLSNIRYLSLALSLTLCSGCESTRYYYQALEGQLSIISKRENISDVLQNSNTSNETRRKLELVGEVREFAAKHLTLKVGDHYSQYVDLEREYVLWNVFAAPRFSIEPKTWCYPIAGCVSYRGYFSKEDAVSYAKSLEQQDFDVYVGGVAAYSTLGWFEDPVLNTFLVRSDADLASLLIHELAHQQLYVEDDSAFNESFATAVELIGMEQWLTHKNRGEEIELIEKQKQRSVQFVDLVLEHRQKLAELYAENLAPSEMTNRKALLKEELLKNYAHLKQSWHGYSGYDRWFAGPLNNAQLATIGTYHHWVESFKTLFQQSDHNWQRFFASCHQIASLNRELRDETLQALSVAATNHRL